ncbi:hypothetical protein ERJ75_001160200 [Trypanosoma vivax]|nr:hypothetical protein ERJ75_001160200 [Trypanosoma vivax]
MKALLDADDALLEAEHALAAANRTLEDVTPLSENAQDKHEALVAALTAKMAHRHATLTRHHRARERAPKPQPKATHSGQQESNKKGHDGEASTAETQSSTDSAHFGWLGVQLAAGMTTFAGRHAEH